MLMMDERIIAKLRRQRRMPMIELYGVECFSAMRAPSLFRVMVAHGPIPPVQDITNGAKEAYSISRTLRSYTLRFSFSWRL